MKLEIQDRISRRKLDGVVVITLSNGTKLTMIEEMWANFTSDKLSRSSID
ncbi:hypothetical protein [Sinorhizobium meliloti]|nr:hypothetical protein [Sinorhizobium meliloti]